jgi:hypothetical protein
MIKLSLARRLAAAASAVGVLSCAEAASTGLRPVIAVNISPSTILLASGADTALTAIVLGNNAEPLTGRAVTWSSSNPSVATVTDAGVVTATVITGPTAAPATITATSGGRTGTALISVLPSVPATITASATALDLADGSTVQLTATVRDAMGNTLTGRLVSWRSSDTLTARVTQSGILRPAGFLNGGERQAFVIVALDSLRDSVTVTVQPTTAEALVITPGSPFLSPGRTRRLRAELRSAAGSVIYGEPVTWSATTPTVADITGDGLVVGVAEGIATVSATSAGRMADATVTVNACGAGPGGAYPIEVRYTGSPPDAAVQAAFDCAVARIREVVVAPLPSVQFTNFSATSCSPGLTLNETVPGLLIFATIESIDGPGGVLGSAGPCFIRNESSLTVVGRMRFDSADLANLAAAGGLQTVIMHEMLHVVGLGTLWTTKDLLVGVGAIPRFLGPLARTACIDDLGGSAVCQEGVLVEDCQGLPPNTNCGSGTINSHWKESTFGIELMTGFLNSGLNPFSTMSIQSLADLGYGVDLSVADEFSIAPAFAALHDHGHEMGIRLPEPTLPTHRVDRFGRATPILRF